MGSWRYPYHELANGSYHISGMGGVDLMCGGVAGVTLRLFSASDG
jgi:hypothetical protein